ncbi:neuroblast differentiation-associated protein AHNAK-like [Salvelinus namaycush]|uniref:Neuroblast differentiation-associated protein AHNAK-like n=1 Tax=Salvelinus namaycush TaxID=8040 RepID=A0A8U0PF67_SALNM|nr:neuroblast differentiation-associated protein AHNAK-like [Salvelinus namaycush]
MCDCFNLGFPNWHGSLGTGSGRRLKGPEPDTVDDSICEEPSEFIEGERPRPQGSSPVDEYPETDKYKDSDKQGGGGSGKKGKRGFGSLFEKRSPAKMSQLESPESGVIVKMAKETCAEGLVVSGGKEGIFIKEVRPESPASKLLSVHEGDQILSATVYFDDVTYEDALQILEHAQPYKMELLLKRKPIKTSTLESEPALEIIQVEEGSSPEMRGHSKTKKHGDRISWPKFPSFSKSQKSHFKRSHSTSEADDKRKLELSPTTSDTESPIKSQEAVMGKTKKHKIKISSMKMKGRKSMSVEQPDQNIHILTVERVEVMENQQSQDDIHSPDGLESASVDTSQVYVLESESEKIESTKIRNECILPNLAGSETKQHKVELISLDKTLKTTDITVALADQEKSAKTLEKYTSEKEGSEKSPDSVEQDVSLTFSVHSSDAFADISSTVTSEQFGPSLASPTKVTVKYSDPIATEVQGDVITSRARTKLIAFEPYLAEKVTTPMSSGVSSSSVDTLKLESGTHVSTSNIQAIPDTQKATLLTDFGLQTGTAGVSSASWSVDDTNKTQSEGQTVIERHVVMEMSGTDRETVFITQKVTHVFGAEPISDETASSIKQMKDTMQSEKMKFFDGAELE